VQTGDDAGAFYFTISLQRLQGMNKGPAMEAAPYGHHHEISETVRCMAIITERNMFSSNPEKSIILSECRIQ